MDIPVVAMIVRSGWVARVILLLLALLSILTWAIIFNRWGYLFKISRLNRMFEGQFSSMKAMSDLDGIDKKYDACPMAALGKTAYQEYKRILGDARADSGVKDW